MNPIWHVETVLSNAEGWLMHVDDLAEELHPYAGAFGEHPSGGLSVWTCASAPDAIRAVQAACLPVMDALRGVGLDPVIRSTQVLTEAEMDAYLASP